MSSKLFLNSAIRYIPQMDFSAQTTENGGVEATQSFLARRSDLGKSNLNPFSRGTRADTLDPNVPSIYRGLSVKTFPHEDHAPGIIKINVTFTGVTAGGSFESTATEKEVPTTTLRGNLEDVPLCRHKKWIDLSEKARARLGWLSTLQGTVDFNIGTSEYGKLDDGEFTAFPTAPGVWAIPTGDELIFATMIAEGDTTYRHAAWDYNYRTESKKGFTAAQLASLGKIVGSPPGNPEKPGSGWTWQLVGPSQDQSGPDRFTKDLSFMLITDNARNQMLYGA